MEPEDPSVADGVLRLMKFSGIGPGAKPRRTVRQLIVLGVYSNLTAPRLPRRLRPPCLPSTPLPPPGSLLVYICSIRRYASLHTTSKH